MNKPFEQYLVENFDRGVIDHSIRSHRGPSGKVTFYVHPSGVDGDTLDFVVRDNSLAPNACDTSDAPVAHVSETAIHEAVLMIDAAGALVERTLATNNSALRKSVEDSAAQLMSLARARLGGKA